MGNRTGCPHVTNSEHAVSLRASEKGTSSTEVRADLVHEAGGKAQARKWKIDIFYQPVSFIYYKLCPRAERTAIPKQISNHSAPRPWGSKLPEEHDPVLVSFVGGKISNPGTSQPVTKL